jgi:hypothetical protein
MRLGWVKKQGTGMKERTPHSEKAGEGLLDTGRPAALYRALRELSCSRCCGVIQEGELFTREEEPASGLPLVRLCRACEPFSRVSGLIDKLLAPVESDDSRPAAETGEAREKVMSRLGPALDLSRRRQ